MATWYAMVCDHNDSWSLFSVTDTEPTDEELLCPEGGHPAVVFKKSPLDRNVRITIAASGGSPTSQADRHSKFFIELSTWDGVNRLLSARTYSWEDALKQAELFHNLSWEDAARRWRHLRMSADEGDAPDPSTAAAESRRVLSRSLAQLSDEIRQGTRVVENETTADFLAAAASWLSDIDGLYRHPGREPISGAAWATFGEVVKAALDYE